MSDRVSQEYSASGEIPLSKTTKFVVDNRGRTAPTEDFGIPLIATNCISNENLYPAYERLRFVSPEIYETWFRSHPQPGDILLTLKGSQNGAVCLVPDPVDFAIAQDMVALRVDEKVIDPLFLFAVLRSPETQAQIKNLDVSGVIPHLKKSDFDKLLLPYPNRAIQQSIGNIYYYLSKKIDLLCKQNKTLEAMAETIFRHWFINEATDFKEEELLGGLITLQRGISYSGKTLGEPGVGLPMHSLNSINVEGDYKYDGIKSFIGDAKPSLILKPGDLLIINTDMTPDNRIIGWPIFVPDKFEKSVCTHHLYSVSLIDNRITKLYLYFLLRSREYRNELANAANGTTVSMLSKESIENLRLKIPPIKRIAEFEVSVKNILDKRHANQLQSETLRTLRDTLLPKLMSGEVRVEF